MPTLSFILYVFIYIYIYIYIYMTTFNLDLWEPNSYIKDLNNWTSNI